MMHTIAATTIAITAQLFLALSWITPTAATDVIGSVLGSSSCRLEQAECVCSPRTFTFRLNFNGSCDINTIQGNPGVNGTQCELRGFPTENEVEDKTPVEVASVDIQEVNVDVDGNQHWRWKRFEGPFYDGDTIEYTSMSDSLKSDEPLGEQDVPKGFFISFTGKNAGDEYLFHGIIWMYNLDNCDAEPITEGNAIGLFEVVEYTSAIPAFCPAVGLTSFELDGDLVANKVKME
ncbi:hypothetical protein QTG54_006148 [Skeletonema marinoi]|uniref:Uncharacterized protein n=1 Tax=Skeletonema marinoi TaxID=267567 RepID=A0AAD8YDL7_9STRA|nr:hypothetical protein QTG54_006148 [Skeletonema marinoi]